MEGDWGRGVGELGEGAGEVPSEKICEGGQAGGVVGDGELVEGRRKGDVVEGEGGRSRRRHKGDKTMGWKMVRA